MKNTKVFQGLSFNEQSTLPSPAQKGDLARDADGLKCYNGATWELVATSPGGWVKFSVSGGIVTVNGQSNVTTVTRSAVGVFTITWDVPFSSANYAVAMTSVNTGGAVYLTFVNMAGAGQTDSAIEIICVDNTFAVADPTVVYVTAIGN